MTSLSLNAVRPGCRPGGVGISPALLSAGLPVDPVLCVRPVFTAFPRSPPPLGPSDGAALAGCHSHRISLSLSAPLSRDDLFRVELDSVAGDEMFYSKVSRSQLDTAWRGCTAEFPLGPLEGCDSCLNILCFSFTEENMGVEQERYQDLQDEGQARGETAQRFRRFLFHSKISLFHLAHLPSTEFYICLKIPSGGFHKSTQFP